MSTLPVSGRLYEHWRPPVYPAGYLRRVGHVGGPTVRGCDDLAARSAFVISFFPPPPEDLLEAPDKGVEDEVLHLTAVDPTEHELGNCVVARVDPIEHEIGNCGVARVDPTEQELGNCDVARVDPTEHELGNYGVARVGPTEQELENCNVARVDPTEHELGNYGVARVDPIEQELGNYEPTESEEGATSPVHERPRSMKDLFKTKVYKGDQGYYALLMSNLGHQDPEKELPARWAGLKNSTKVWHTSSAAEEYEREILHPQLARELYTLPSEVLMA
ncbi:hypothetical protein B296_00020060 [Ensete ventricosum]|uniref:Uncharacterized protein n=1 Tax=Ensete ventricosum TaxID=4639 RepID=A0A426XXQ6_ENSVE|nr:hypothetical protein B296_00020060 [Ensete ventricosum]